MNLRERVMLAAAFGRKVLNKDDDGAYRENTRLRPLIERLAECVDTIEKLKPLMAMFAHQTFREGASELITEALTALTRELERLEGCDETKD